VRQRQQLSQSLAAFQSLTVYPSQANFILVRTAEGQAVDIHQKLKDAGILVKKLHGGHPSLHDCLRINVSSSDENALLIAALQQIL